MATSAITKKEEENYRHNSTKSNVTNSKFGVTSLWTRCLCLRINQR